jgi:hypothetical protein
MTDFLLLLKILIACNPYHSKVISEHTKYLQFTKALFSLKLPKQNPVSLNQLPIKFVAWWKIKKALIEGFLIKTFWQFLVGIRCFLLLILFYYLQIGQIVSLCERSDLRTCVFRSLTDVIHTVFNHSFISIILFCFVKSIIGTEAKQISIIPNIIWCTWINVIRCFCNQTRPNWIQMNIAEQVLVYCGQETAWHSCFVWRLSTAGKILKSNNLMNPNSDIYPLFDIFPMSKLDNEDFQSES